MRRTWIACVVVSSCSVALVPTVPAATAPTRTVGTLPDARVSSVKVPTAPRFKTSAKQIVVVTAPRNKTSHARLGAYQRVGSGWQHVMNVKARIGRNGLVLAGMRRQGSLTTPAGMFSMSQAFGINANPGTAMPFTRIDAGHYWVGDNSSPFYNEMRRASQGGFKRKTSEHMIRYRPDYKYGVVIDFNRPNPVRGRGFAIFLHVNGAGATAGCVSVGANQMKTLLRWLDPAQAPAIVIGKDAWLSGT